jgi:hypothetical protein
MTSVACTLLGQLMFVTDRPTDTFVIAIIDRTLQAMLVKNSIAIYRVSRHFSTIHIVAEFFGIAQPSCEVSIIARNSSFVS